MVQFTEYEQSMLDGDMGEFKQMAMKFIVRYADVLWAEELCEVSRATLFIGAQHYLDCYQNNEDYKKKFSEFYLCSEKIIEFGKWRILAKLKLAQLPVILGNMKGLISVRNIMKKTADSWK